MSEMKAIRAAYGEALAALGVKNEKIVALDADLAHATMTLEFAKVCPERFFNAGIAEANMVSMAAGLSSMGYIPFCSTFAVFWSRKSLGAGAQQCSLSEYERKACHDPCRHYVGGRRRKSSGGGGSGFDACDSGDDGFGSL